MKTVWDQARLSSLVYCFALQCFTLHYTVLHGNALHYNALHCTALPSFYLYCTALHYTTMHFPPLHCTTLHCTILHCTELHCTELNCTILHYTAVHCTVWPCTALYCIPYAGLWNITSVRCQPLSELSLWLPLQQNWKWCFYEQNRTSAHRTGNDLRCSIGWYGWDITLIGAPSCASHDILFNHTFKHGKIGQNAVFSGAKLNFCWLWR